MYPGVCSKNFPKDFSPVTVATEDGFPTYRRRNNGRTIVKTVGRNEVHVDNRFVVPYNPYLLQKYDCHINVEVCSSVKCVKYLYKYVCKGHDATVAEVSRDEIKEFVDARYLSAHEAIWRILALPLFEVSHTIVRLNVHLPNEQQVFFNAGADIEEVVNNRKDTQLEAFFKLCEEDEFARRLTYQEVPIHYVWNTKDEIAHWKRRERFVKGVIPRMYTVSPMEGERFFLRMLLTAVRGPTSFEDLKTHNGMPYESFKDAAVARGLIENDVEYNNCMAEAKTFRSAPQLRHLLVVLMVYCNPGNLRLLFDTHYDGLSEDLNHVADEDIRRAHVLQDINAKLQLHGKTLADFPALPEYLPDLLVDDQDEGGNRLLREEQAHSRESIDEGLACIANLNAQQREVF